MPKDRLDDLFRKLEKHDWAENRKTAEALAELGQGAFSHLLNALKSEDGYVRNGAAVALGKIGNKEATPALLQALRWRDERIYEDDEDSEARVSAARALGALRDGAACTALINLLEEGSVREGNLKSYIIDALGEIGDTSAIPTLARMTEDQNSETQLSACAALGKMGSEGTEILLKLARDKVRRARQCATRVLGTSRSRPAVPTLLAVLEDPADEERVRCEAARALGRIGLSPEILPALREALNGSSENIRSAALMGLGYSRDVAAYEAIIQRISDTRFRYVAVMALGELGDVRACELLKDMLNHKDSSLRFHAATAIGKIGCADAMAALVELRAQLAASSSPLSGAEMTSIDATIRMLERKADK